MQPDTTKKAPAGDLLVLCNSPAEMADQASQFLADLLGAAVAQHGRAVAALAGGTTPAPVYGKLATSDMPWDQICFLQGDERLVPASHPHSNYRMILDRFGLDKWIIPMIPVQRGPSSLQPQRLAADYGRKIGHLARRRRGKIPILDVMVLGLGTDGHVMSLFPGAAALEEKETVLVVNGPGAEAGDSPDVNRLTLSLPVLNAAERLVFLVSGTGKAAAVRQALQGGGEHPVGRLQDRGQRLVWFLDSAAASHLGSLD